MGGCYECMPIVNKSVAKGFELQGAANRPPTPAKTTLKASNFDDVQKALRIPNLGDIWGFFSSMLRPNTSDWAPQLGNTT